MLFDFLTVAKNFGPWLGAAVLAGFLAGSAAGYQAGKLVYQGRAYRAEAALEAFKGELAAQSLSVEISAQRRQAQALNAITERNEAMTYAVSQITPRILAALQPQLVKFRESIHAPEFDCLRQPLPPGALGVFERQGGFAAGADH